MSAGTAGPEVIDWEAVRARLRQAEAATQEALEPSPERAREIMEARARTLARPPPPAPAPGARIQVLLFGLDRVRYAIETRFVSEVAHLVSPTPLPRAPDFVAGVANLRGGVLMIVDLGRFFGIAAGAPSERAHLVVLGRERPELGFPVDRLHEITELTPGELLTPAEEVSGIARAYVRGLTAQAWLVLDGATLLADPRLVLDGRPSAIPPPERE